MIIRPAAPTDLPAIAALVDEHTRRGDVLPRSIAAIRASLSDWLVAEEDGAVLACVSLLNYTSQLAEVRSLVVHDRVKGQGWGSALVHALIAEAHRRDIPILFALTRTVPFFEQSGFTTTDREMFPEKVWRDCQLCPVREHCDETAVVLQLASVPHLGNS